MAALYGFGSEFKLKSRCLQAIEEARKGNKEWLLDLRKPLKVEMKDKRISDEAQILAIQRSTLID